MRRSFFASSTRIFGLLALTSLGAAALGCGVKPPCSPQDAKGCVIEKIRVLQHSVGSSGKVSGDDVKARIATAESSFPVTKTTVDFFGERGTLLFRYERFDRLVLERDLARVERYYRARGYYEARARAGRVLRTGESTVVIEIEVDEGPPTLVTKVDLELLDPKKPLPTDADELGTAVTDAKNTIEVGSRFEEDPYEATKKSILRAMTDRGFAYAKVVGRVEVDLARHAAHLTFAVEAGPPCKFGEITFEGLGDLPEAPMRAVLAIRPGRRFSTDALDGAQTALNDFGVLGAVSVEVVRTPEGQPPNPVVPIRFLVQKAALRSIQLGGGAELGGRVQARLVAAWENKNFFGGLRRFLVAARPGLVFYPLQLSEWNKKVTVLPELRTELELRQPGFIEARTNAYFRGEVNFYRPVTADSSVDTEALNLYENLEIHGALGVDRPFLRSRLRLGVAYNAQYIEPVAIRGVRPPGFESLFVSYGEVRAALDFRTGKNGKRDAANPHSGVYLGATIQAAGAGGDARDLRIQPEVRAYAPISKEVTLGFRFTAGFLFPDNYGERLFGSDASCANDSTGCQNQRARDVQILQLRGFYSGGPGSNRGYNNNGVNPREIVPSLFTDAKDATPVAIGGRFLWESSLELRFPIYGDFGGVVFADASDVWNDQLVWRPHLAPGLGLRYATPVGPIRLDLGWRVCAQDQSTCTEAAAANGGPPRLLGLPVYISIAIGEAF